jgi:hypothetical protein
MDDIVKRALVKWPNVPHCTGWLLLDRRGNWRMRDEAAQAAGTNGTLIRHPALIGFICRNYECDALGQWFFQNGPQRVYVELAYTPWVVRLMADETNGTPMLTLTDHTGAAFEPSAVFADDEGAILLTDTSNPPRVAVLHDHDLGLFAEASTLSGDGQNGEFHWRAGLSLPLQAMRRGEIAACFGFVASPASRQRESAALPSI